MIRKRSALVIFLCILLTTTVQAAANSIYDYLQEVDDQYYLVVGNNGKGGDTLAAIDVAIGLKENNPSNVDIEPVVEGTIPPSSSKILIGHPCDNSLIVLSCAAWPYKVGEALIAVMGNDLIIAGTTVEDTRRAAKIILNYPQYSMLRTETQVIIGGRGIYPRIENMERAKTAEELVCGDGVCESGEGSSCFIDCSELSCFDLCQQEGFSTAACRSKKTNPAVPSCSVDEVDRGEGYCAMEKVCCCEKQEQEINLEKKTENEVIEQREIREVNAITYVISSFLVALILLAIIGVFLLFRKQK